MEGIPEEATEPKQGTLLAQQTQSIENRFKICVEFSQKKRNGTFNAIYLTFASNDPVFVYMDKNGLFMVLT